ncbi:hypothetical protein KLEP174_gp08 [Pseudomonas phage vB_PcuM_ KLEP17-4]|nr:hypothetical protein KLEP174_gp08 [Pseudomonas phage vB_PcuM_ KLEP17-4]
MADLYVYSTLSNDQRYVSYTSGASGVPKPESSIFIAGQANLMNKHFVTPRGVATKVTAEQLAELRNNDLFKLHMKNGFITVSESKMDAEIVAADMEGRDQSAPIVEQDEEIPAPAIETVEVETPRRGRTRRS